MEKFVSISNGLFEETREKARQGSTSNGLFEETREEARQGSRKSNIFKPNLGYLSAKCSMSIAHLHKYYQRHFSVGS